MKIVQKFFNPWVQKKMSKKTKEIWENETIVCKFFTNLLGDIDQCYRFQDIQNTDIERFEADS